MRDLPKQSGRRSLLAAASRILRRNEGAAGSRTSRASPKSRNLLTIRVQPAQSRLQWPPAVDSAVVAYVEWRAASIAVKDAYSKWSKAAAEDRALAHRAYEAALDREQAAAENYAVLVRTVGHLVESGLDYPLGATA